MIAKLAAVVVLTMLVPAVAQAQEPEVVATGLDNPRGLAFAGEVLYVAEAGRGGNQACFHGAEGGEVCLGPTGAITKVHQKKQARIRTGLPSIASKDGTRAQGPSDVAPKHGSFVFTVGLGADPARRDLLPDLGKDTAWLLDKHGEHVADLGAYEASANPDGGVPDTNPTSVVATPDGYAVVDAGGNSFIGVDDELSTIATFPSQQVLAPPSMGLPPGTKIPVQAVPTSVAIGPDRAFYVGELTGFPFVEGVARVYKVWPGGKPRVFAKGFTNIMDLAFGPDGTLYVLEIAHKGLLAGPEGALLKVNQDGTHETVLDQGLNTPTGLTIHDGHAYISNCGTCPGEGTVIRVPLS